MLKEDFVIQANVRRVLVCSNIDYTTITFGTVKGVVYFRGLFRLARIYLYGDDEKMEHLKVQDFIQKTLTSLEKKVRNLPGVRDIMFQFVNWRKERGQWIPVEERKGLEPGFLGAPKGTSGKEGEWVVVEKDGEWVVEEKKEEKEGEK
jgi:hypothetical protein